MIDLPSHADLAAIIEQDRLAKIEWRAHVVAQANANAALAGFTPDAQLSDMQQRFIAGELDTETMLQIIRDLTEKAGIKLPDPTPHDMGLD